MSCPRTLAVPAVGWRSPSRISTVVVFPAPLGTVRERWSTALRSPYVFTSPSISMTGRIHAPPAPRGDTQPLDRDKKARALRYGLVRGHPDFVSFRITSG